MAGLCVLLAAPGSFANTFSVLNSGASAYVINGNNNPSLTLFRGQTYTFNINAVNHPFWIKTVAGTGTGNAYNSGISNNGIQTGTLTFNVPLNAPNTLFYNCQFHSSMTGTINIQDPPPRGWWRFESAGVHVPDVSGYGMTGVVENMNFGADDGTSGFSTDVPGALIVAGGSTNANLLSLRFAKGAGRVRILEPSRFAIPNAQGQVTVEAFIKITSTNLPMRIINIANTTGAAPATLISPFLSDLGPAPYPALSIHSDSNTVFYTTFATAIAPSPVAHRHWHHVAFVQDGTASRFYVDYQFAGEWDGTGEYLPGPFTGVNEITLGGIATEQNNAFEGLLDEIRVTDRALAPSEFLRVVNGLAPGLRAFPSAESPAVFTVITQTDSLYRIQGAASLDAAPQSWTNIGGVFTGRVFYTTITNAGTPAAFYRAVRGP